MCLFNVILCDSVEHIHVYGERGLPGNREGRRFVSENKNKVSKMKSVWCGRGKEEQRQRLGGQGGRRGGECT